MRKYLTLAAILIAMIGVALPSAANVACNTGTIEWVGDSPRLHDDNPEDRNGVYWGLVGDWMWYYFGESAPDDPETASSFFIYEDASFVRVCADGTIQQGDTALDIANYQYPTTTTYPEETTTSTDDTTTTSQGESTTTTTAASSTSSSVASTSTTTLMVTTTSVTSSSSSAPTTVPQTVSTDPSTPGSTLPFTGVDQGFLKVLAGVSILLGAILLATGAWDRHKQKLEDASQEFRPD